MTYVFGSKEVRGNLRGLKQIQLYCPKGVYGNSVLNRALTSVLSATFTLLF